MRLIDADALKETIVSNVYPVVDYINSHDYGMFWTGGIEKAIDEQPTIEERKTGKWRDTGSGQECNICGEIQYGYDTGRHFCANCGADMREQP